jgi:extracellular elastinolytic metalloproteinase
MPNNWASTTHGGTVSGDGANLINLIDDTENTQWESTTAPVAGKQVTVNLGSARTVKYVQVSAMLSPGQNRFSALRNFEVWTCTASLANANCTIGGFTKVLTSPSDAFPAVAPRPVAPDLILRTFNLATPVSATHVRLVVAGSQCTAGPAYAGEQDNDPLNSTDCTTQSANAGQVRAGRISGLRYQGGCGLR